MGKVTEIKFFTLLWGLFMSLYFIFGSRGAIWNTAFYSITILMGINNANPSRNFIDIKWKNINCLILKIIFTFFVLCYIEDALDNPFINTCIGTAFAIILGLNVYKDVARNK
jgi:Na+-translocating ferredoxin:NAD+ oxidoreductase RnfD subunit